jgi:hypothetical protein
MPHRAIQPSTVREFWDQVRLVGSPYDAAVAIGVSRNAGWKWLGDAGGVKPRVSKPKKMTELPEHPVRWTNNQAATPCHRYHKPFRDGPHRTPILGGWPVPH